jgi:hypothetical protein
MYDSEYKSNARYIDKKKTVLCLEPLPISQGGNLLIEKISSGAATGADAIAMDATVAVRWAIVDKEGNG